jgi:hypothetical protein
VSVSSVIEKAMESLSKRRPLFHSEADFQHVLAWEVQTAHPAATIRLEKRVATAPSIELDLLITLDGRTLGVELKYPRRSMTAEVDGELFTLVTGADDHGRFYAIEDLARLERLVDTGVIDGGAFVLLTNVANVWEPPSSNRRVLFEAFRIHEGHVLTGTMAWGDWGSRGGRPSGTGTVELRGSYALRWRHYSTVASAELRYLIVDVDPA